MNSLWNTFRRNLRRKSTPITRKPARRPWLEALEDRCVPTTVTVSPGAMNNWAFDVRDLNGVLNNNPTGSAGFVAGPATPPAGVGSAFLHTGNGVTGGDGSAELRNTGYAGVLLSQLTSLSYDTYATQWNGQQLPYLSLDIDYTGDGIADDRIYFEPPFQTPTSGNLSLPNQGSETLNQWQHWNALAGGWYSDNAIASSGPGTAVISLAAYIAAEPTATIVNTPSGLGGVRLTSGFASANDQFNAYVDNFTIGTGSSTTFDFENVPPPVVYVNQAWAGLNPGVDPDGAGPATVFGGDAFATIQAGVNAVAIGGTVNVYAGIYSEDVNMSVKAGIQLLSVAGAGSTSIVGQLGGANETVLIGANQILDGFTITRALGVGENNIGLTITTGSTGSVVRNNILSGNRTAIYVNGGNSQATITRNVIDDNRTGILLTDGTGYGAYQITQNAITHNKTFGILINIPTAISPNFTILGNNISGNYAVQLENNSGSSVNASGNWWGTTAPVATASQINGTLPPAFVYPGPVALPGSPYPYVITGSSANLVDYTPYLNSATDTDGATPGFQGDFSYLNVTAASPQVGPVGRVQEGVNLLADGSLTGGARLVNVLAGTYAEVINVNKSATLQGAAAFASALAPTTGAQQSVIKIDAVNVTIDGFAIQVNQYDDPSIGGVAPIAPVGISAVNVVDFNGLTIKNNQITSIGNNAVQWTGSPGLSLRAAGIVLYDSPSGGIPTVTIQNNSVDITSGTSFFQRAVWLAQLNTTFTGNTLKGVANDLQFQFPSGGASLIDNNNFFGVHSLGGGGVVIADPNAGAPITISNNTFTPTVTAFTGTSLQINRNAVAGSPIAITGNTFNGVVNGIDIGGARDVSVSGNTLTPKAGTAGYVLIRVDSQNASNNGSTLTPINTTIDGNTFNTAAGSTGTAVLVANNLVGSNFTGVSVGVTSDNSYQAGITTGVSVTGGSVTVEDTIAGLTTGIDVTGGSATITNSHIYNNGTGVRFTNGGTGSVTNNNFDDTTDNGTDLRLDSTAGAVTIGAGNLFAGDSYYIDNQSNQAFNLTGANAQTYDLSNNFRIEDHLYHAPDNAASGLITWVADNLYVTTPGTGASDETIQRAIAAASAGNTVNVESGTFVENVVLNKRLTLTGSGGGTLIAPSSGIGVTLAASGTDSLNRVVVQQLAVQGATNGFQVDSAVSYVTLSDVVATGATYGFEVHNSAVVQDLLLTNVSLTNSVVGFRVATTGSVDGLTITNGHFDNNSGGGLETFASNSFTNNQTRFTNITITGTTFNGNSNKGLYFEKLDNALISGIQVIGSGSSGSDGAGIDVNLKYGTYSTIIIQNSTITNSGTGNPVSGQGVTIKGRNDGSYSGNPASLSGLNLTGLSVSGSPVDLAIGNNVTIVTLSGNSLSGTGVGFVSFITAPGTLDLADTAFAGTLATYIVNSSANAATATAATFNGLTGAGASLAQNFAIEDKITHATDNSALGLVRVKSGNVFVTPNSGSIQRGYDAAVANDLLQVQSGNYTENVTLGAKAITLVTNGTSAAGVVNVTGSVSFGSGTTFQVDILTDAGTPVAGTDYDQWNVGGSFSAGSAILDIVSAVTPPINLTKVFTIIDGSGANSPAFRNDNAHGNAVLSDSTAFQQDGDNWYLNYNAAGANVTLQGSFNNPPVLPLTPVFNTLEDGLSFNILLDGSDIETPTDSLIFTVTSLPEAGTLFFGGVPVLPGQNFSGNASARTLVYVPGGNPQLYPLLGSYADSFGYSVTDGGGVNNSNPLTTVGSVTVNVSPSIDANTTQRVTNDALAGGNVLFVYGSAASESITITKSGTNYVIARTGSPNVLVPTAGIVEIRVWGRQGNDVINTGTVTVPVRVLAGEGNDNVFTGAGNDIIYGGAGNDYISAGAGNDFANGGDGDDTLYGGAGDDFLNGGAGNDFLFGETGDDVLAVQGAEALGDRLNGGPGSDTLSLLADSVFSSFNSSNLIERIVTDNYTILGTTGNNVLNFSTITSVTTDGVTPGILRVDGLGGADTITGTKLPTRTVGLSDYFVFNPATATAGTETSITNFVQGYSKLDVSAYGALTLAPAAPSFPGSPVSDVIYRIQSGADTLLLLNGKRIRIKNFTATTLATTDFVGSVSEV